jgi:hypothetical protein
LDALADSNVVIVPGGGPFADQVRSVQRRWSFGDATAHAMALLAMGQYGLMLSGLCPKLGTARDIRELRALAESGRATVWLPDLSLIDDTSIPASWDVTSDSLAAWLAGCLSAANLLLVKSAAIPSGAASYGELLAQGMVDDAFEYFSSDAAFAAWLGHRQDYPRAREGLREPTRVFTRVDRFAG